jgi:hypothetical protein
MAVKEFGKACETYLMCSALFSISSSLFLDTFRENYGLLSLDSDTK